MNTILGSWTVKEFSCKWFLPLLAVACIWLAPDDAAGTPITPGPAETDYPFSFVRGYVPAAPGVTPNVRTIAETDVSYANDIKNMWVGSSVDIMMQQCFSGG